MSDRSQATDPATLTNATTRFLDPATTAEERQALRRASSTPENKMAYEQQYVDGEYMDQPQAFVRHTLAALFLTRGFTSRESAQQILAELRLFAADHQLDFDLMYQEVSELPGARRSGRNRRSFALMNIGLFAGLILGTIVIYNFTTPPLQIILQLGLLLGIVTAQLLLLYRRLA